MVVEYSILKLHFFIAVLIEMVEVSQNDYGCEVEDFAMNCSENGEQLSDTDHVDGENGALVCEHEREEDGVDRAFYGEFCFVSLDHNL